MLRAAYLILVLTLGSPIGGAEKSLVYRNPEFGITVPVPSGTLSCPTSVNEHDHGPVFLVNATDTKGCHSLDHNRYIGIFASYNAVDETKRIYDFLNSECQGVYGGPCDRAPARLYVRGLRSASARVSERSGWLDVVVVTQAGKPDPLYDATVPSVNYDINLHTKPPYLDEDLRIFRELLRTIRLAPPN